MIIKIPNTELFPDPPSPPAVQEEPNLCGSLAVKLWSPGTVGGRYINIDEVVQKPIKSLTAVPDPPSPPALAWDHCPFVHWFGYCCPLGP